MPCNCKSNTTQKQIIVSCEKCSKDNNSPNNNCASETTDNGSRDENSKMLQYSDGPVKLQNPNIERMDQDILYHLALGSGSHDLVKMFGDVKFVCMGGTAKRAEQFAHYMMEQIDHTLPTGATLEDITQLSHRYAMYKVGPVLSVSHGMGVPSLSILLHEITKLMYHARVRDPIFIRIGTSGGIGLEPGTVVISDGAVDGMMETSHKLKILGKIVSRPAILDMKLVKELKAMHNPNDPYNTVSGKTMCADDFYEEQGRLDGAFCDFSEADRMEYLHKIHKHGVVNIEMECVAFAALTHYAGIKSAIVCVTFIDRFKGDQVVPSKEVLNEWQMRPPILVGRYIKKYLQLKAETDL